MSSRPRRSWPRSMSSWARWPSNRITHSVWLRSVSMRLSVRLGRWTLALALVSAFLVLGGSIYPECFPPECPEGARCSPVCVAGILMPGSSPLAWAGLMAASLAFGLLTIRAVRRPALTAILGLTWLAAWAALTAWLSDLAGGLLADHVAGRRDGAALSPFLDHRDGRYYQTRCDRARPQPGRATASVVTRPHRSGRGWRPSQPPDAGPDAARHRRTGRAGRSHLGSTRGSRLRASPPIGADHAPPAA